MNAATVSTAGRREWIGLAVLALPCLLYSMDLTVLYLALPKLTAALHPTSTQLLWITDIYGFFLAGLLITMGTFGDRIGRRRLLLSGAVAFGTASAFAAFSTSAEMLIVARAVLGVAAATLAPSTLSLIRNMFLDEGQRTIAVGIWIASFSVGAAVGPLVGGALLEFFWWGSVFLAGLPVTALLLVLGPVLLPEFRDPAPGRLDVVSAALSLLSVLALIYGLKQIAAAGFDAQPLVALAAGAFLAAVFVQRQRNLDDPLVDVRLFLGAAFTIAVAAMCIAVFLVAGTDFYLGQYLQLVFGKSPFVAGLWMLPGSLIGVGAGAVGTLATDFVVNAAPAERAGAASAISETGAELGGALGVAILGSIGAAVYRSDVAAEAPSALSEAQLERSKESLAGAVDLGGTLSARVRTDVVEAGRAAFTHALHLGALSAAVVATALAVLAALSLRGSGQAEPGPPLR